MFIGKLSCVSMSKSEGRKKKLPQSISFLDYGSKGTATFAGLPYTDIIRVPYTDKVYRASSRERNAHVLSWSRPRAFDVRSVSGSVCHSAPKSFHLARMSSRSAT